MTVKDIISLALLGELSSVNIKNNDAAIVAFINLGMVELYKRFRLKIAECEIKKAEEQLVYMLPEDFMYSYEGELVFEEGGQSKKEPISLNSEEVENKVVFFDQHSVKISSPKNWKSLTLTYVAKPKKYSSDAILEEVDIPDTLLDCLLHYIGYRGHLSVRSDSQSETNSHYARFERSVAKAKELGVVPLSDAYTATDRLYDRGFV